MNACVWRTMCAGRALILFLLQFGSRASQGCHTALHETLKTLDNDLEECGGEECSAATCRVYAINESETILFA